MSKAALSSLVLAFLSGCASEPVARFEAYDGSGQSITLHADGRLASPYGEAEWLDCSDERHRCVEVPAIPLIFKIRRFCSPGESGQDVILEPEYPRWMPGFGFAFVDSPTSRFGIVVDMPAEGVLAITGRDPETGFANMHFNLVEPEGFLGCTVRNPASMPQLD